MIDTMLTKARAANWQMYSPVLRAKTSEWKALAALAPAVRQRIFPIIEFVPEWKTPGAGTPGRKPRGPQTPTEYVRRMLAASLATTPAGTQSFVYFDHAGPSGRWKNVDLWAEFSAVNTAGALVPLATLASAERVPGLADAVRAAQGRVGLRLHTGDLRSPVAGRLEDTLRRLAVNPAQVHLVIDLASDPQSVSHAAIAGSVGNVGSFGSVIVVAGVFPPDLTGYKVGVASEPRVEWATWWSEHASAPRGSHLLAFGDYTTQCPHYQPSPAVAGSVSLRYTTDDAVLVFRGNKANSQAGLGNEQMHGHCRLLVRRADYDGAAFSAGDQRVYCWTDSSTGHPGNAEHWRTASLVHHITHVVVQLADSAGHSAAARTWARGQVPPPCASQRGRKPIARVAS
ncbi:MAG: beta family protein [Gemmatimonadaceae bacterium]